MTGVLGALALAGVGVVAVFLVVQMASPTGPTLPVKGPPTPTPPKDTPAPDMPRVWAPKLTLTLGDPRTSGLAKWTPDFDAAPVKAFDFDGDGDQELVAHGNDTKVYVFDARTGRVLATLPTTYPPAWHIERILNGVEAARLRPGEPPSIVVTNHAAYLAVWQFVPGNSTPDKFTFKKSWEQRLPATSGEGVSMDAKPVLADLEGHGELAIIVHEEERNGYAFRPDGKLLWKASTGGGNAEPAVGDLDGDGTPEVVFASDSGLVTVVDGRTGATRWTYDAGATLWPASISVAPTIAELDGAAPKEVVFTARDARDRKDFRQNHMAVFAVHGVDGRGVALWTVRPSWANPLSYTHLIVHDVDGDGAPDVCGQDWNTIGHIPGDWDLLGPAHVFCLDADGSEKWVREVQSWWSNKDLVLGDLDGDGRLDLLTETSSIEYGDVLLLLDAATGTPRSQLSLGSWKLERGPIVADLYGSGRTQMVAPVRTLDDAPQGALLLFDLRAAFHAPWPGHVPLR